MTYLGAAVVVLELAVLPLMLAYLDQFFIVLIGNGYHLKVLQPVAPSSPDKYFPAVTRTSTWYSTYSYDVGLAG